MKNDVLSVSQLNQKARLLLEKQFNAIWVSGEISNFVKPQSGHWYFTLKDDSAQVRCAMFRNRNTRLKFLPDQGMQVVVFGRVSLYEGRGDYQLIVEHLEPAGEGALQKAFEQLKQRLAAEGLFAKENKKIIPAWPRRIILVTSPSGAAVKDMLTVLKRRFPILPIDIIPVPVQGREAAPAIVQAIDWLNTKAELNERRDIIILARGGGSLEDLWPFNEETVARSISNSRLPIVTGIGHEIDFTISDFVADIRAATPSAAAELISPDQNEVRKRFADIQQSLYFLVNDFMQKQRRDLDHYSTNLPNMQSIILENSQKLDLLQLNLQKNYGRQRQLYATRLQLLSQRLKHPNQQLSQYRHQLSYLNKRLLVAIETILNGHKAKQANISERLNARLVVAKLEACRLQKDSLRKQLMQIMQSILRNQRLKAQFIYKQLDNLSPLTVLARGYGLVFEEPSKQLITSVSEIQPKDSARIQLADGSFTCKIETIDFTND